MSISFEGIFENSRFLAASSKISWLRAIVSNVSIKTQTKPEKTYSEIHTNPRTVLSILLDLTLMFTITLTLPLLAYPSLEPLFSTVK